MVIRRPCGFFFSRNGTHLVKSLEKTVSNPILNPAAVSYFFFMSGLLPPDIHQIKFFTKLTMVFLFCSFFFPPCGRKGSVHLNEISSPFNGLQGQSHISSLKTGGGVVATGNVKGGEKRGTFAMDLFNGLLFQNGVSWGKQFGSWVVTQCGGSRLWEGGIVDGQTPSWHQCMASLVPKGMWLLGEDLTYTLIAATKQVGLYLGRR